MNLGQRKKFQDPSFVALVKAIIVDATPDHSSGGLHPSIDLKGQGRCFGDPCLCHLNAAAN